MHYDVFNGDADGIIALLQLRLSKHKPHPKESILVTGVKRDISLLKNVDAESSNIGNCVRYITRKKRCSFIIFT